MKSVEKELCKAIMNDPDARAQIAGAENSGERTSIIVRLGEVLGLPVSREAVERFLAPPPDGELSDRELEAVVGGKGGDSGEGRHIVGHERTGWNMLWCLSDDVLIGGDGDDTMEGLGGDDHAEGGEGNDFIDGGEGDDRLWGEKGDDTLVGGDGEDFMLGGVGNDSLDGGSGDDDMLGQDGDDILDGGQGDDSLDGGEGDDSLVGGAGNDVLVGGMGSDTFEGGAGNDTLDGGVYETTFSGQHDVFIFGQHDGHDTIIGFDRSSDTLLLKGVDSPDDIEVVQFAGSTYIAFGDTRIELRDVLLSKEQVWRTVSSGEESQP